MKVDGREIVIEEEVDGKYKLVSKQGFTEEGIDEDLIRAVAGVMEEGNEVNWLIKLIFNMVSHNIFYNVIANQGFNE